VLLQKLGFVSPLFRYGWKSPFESPYLPDRVECCVQKFFSGETDAAIMAGYYRDVSCGFGSLENSSFQIAGKWL
jgi:hypothetical protein